MTNKIIFILGTGHCGSTLLDLMLGSHSRSLSLGEVYRLAKGSPLEIPCDICGKECEFWNKDLLQSIARNRQQSFFFKWVKPLLNKFLLGKRIAAKVEYQVIKNEAFYELLIQHSGKHVLVDSSKDHRWITSGMKRILKTNHLKPYLIYLSRDGRAVVNSYYRKYPGKGLETLAYQWNKRITDINKCYNNWRGAPKITIKYEELATKPRDTMENICEFLGIPFEYEMMKFWQHDHHPINGNSGTKSFITKFKKNNGPAKVQESKKKYYESHNFGIRLDERWKKELKDAELSIVNEIISENNRDIKYDDN